MPRPVRPCPSWAWPSSPPSSAWSLPFMGHACSRRRRILAFMFAFGVFVFRFQFVFWIVAVVIATLLFLGILVHTVSSALLLLQEFSGSRHISPFWNSAACLHVALGCCSLGMPRLDCSSPLSSTPMTWSPKHRWFWSHLLRRTGVDAAAWLDGFDGTQQGSKKGMTVCFPSSVRLQAC